MKNFIAGFITALLCVWGYSTAKDPANKIGQYCKNEHGKSIIKILDYSDKTGFYWAEYAEGASKGKKRAQPAGKILHCERDYESMVKWVKNHKK